MCETELRVHFVSPEELHNTSRDGRQRGDDHRKSKCCESLPTQSSPVYSSYVTFSLTTFIERAEMISCGSQISVTPNTHAICLTSKFCWWIRWHVIVNNFLRLFPRQHC